MERTYWDFYVGFGLFVTVFLLFAAAMAWQLGSVPAPVLSQVRSLAWLLTLTFAAVLFLSWRYFFIAPMVFSAVIFACLLAGTLLSRTTPSMLNDAEQDWVFGHVHGGYGRESAWSGMTLVNCAVVDNARTLANAPAVVELTLQGYGLENVAKSRPLEKAPPVRHW